MKTKINLTLLTVLLASLTLASCTELPGDIEWKEGEFPNLGISYAEYTITFNEEAKSEGYVLAYVKDGDKEIGVNRANEGDEVFLRARGYSGFEFLEWFPNGVTLDQPQADETSFIMPDNDVSFQVNFDNTNAPMATPVDIIKKIGYSYNPITGVYTKTNDGDRDKPENVKLREWKAQQNQHVWVWFDAWSGRKDDGANSMRGLPDEVDLIAQWGQPKWNLSDFQKADMQYVKEVKGAKVVVTLFAASPGEDVDPDPAYNIGNSTDEATIRPAIAKYARAIYDKVIANDYDGFDWDFEPGYGGSAATSTLWYNKTQATMFLEELSYYFGKEAKTKSPRNANGIDRGSAPTKDLLLCVDGAVHNSDFNLDFTYNVDFYVQQAYGVSGISACQGRIGGIVSQLTTHIANGKLTREDAIRRCILTENFENASYAASGGGLFDMANVTFEGFDTGGFGAYRVGNSYRSTAEEYRGSAYYTHLRKAIDMQYGTGPRE